MKGLNNKRRIYTIYENLEDPTINAFAFYKNIKDNYSEGLMKFHKAVFYVNCTHYINWRRLEELLKGK